MISSVQLNRITTIYSLCFVGWTLSRLACIISMALMKQRTVIISLNESYKKKLGLRWEIITIIQYINDHKLEMTAIMSD